MRGEALVETKTGGTVLERVCVRYVSVSFLSLTFILTDRQGWVD